MKPFLLNHRPIIYLYDGLLKYRKTDVDFAVGMSVLWHHQKPSPKFMFYNIYLIFVVKYNASAKPTTKFISIHTKYIF